MNSNPPGTPPAAPSGAAPAAPEPGRPAAPPREGQDAQARFAAALRQARRQAGDPPYSDLVRRSLYSKATFSRMLTGKIFPRWDATQQLLGALGVPGDQMGVWRDRWVSALEEIRPIGLAGHTADPSLGDETTAGEDHPEPATEPASPLRASRDLPASSVCEDCGALIGDLTQHQAWHWNIERQLRRATLRPVESSGH